MLPLLSSNPQRRYRIYTYLLNPARLPRLRTYVGAVADGAIDARLERCGEDLFPSYLKRAHDPLHHSCATACIYTKARKRERPRQPAKCCPIRCRTAVIIQNKNRDTQWTNRWDGLSSCHAPFYSLFPCLRDAVKSFWSTTQHKTQRIIQYRPAHKKAQHQVQAAFLFVFCASKEAHLTCLGPLAGCSVVSHFFQNPQVCLLTV